MGGRLSPADRRDTGFGGSGFSGQRNDGDQGAAELRVKESDRISSLVRELTRMGGAWIEENRTA